MALVKCLICGQENVDDKAETCPRCGYCMKYYYHDLRRKEEIMQGLHVVKSIDTERQAELDKIKMPNKPGIGTLLFTFFGAGFCFFGWAVLICYWMNKEDPFWLYEFCFWFFLVFWIFGTLSSFKCDLDDYKFAQKNFRAYQEQKLREKKQAEEQAKARNNARKYQSSYHYIECPSCGSFSTEEISQWSRSMSVKAYGMASPKIGKQYQCKNCGHMW